MTNFSRNLRLLLAVTIALICGSTAFAEQAESAGDMETVLEQSWLDFQDEYNGLAAPQIADPLRGMNRPFYHFNDIMMIWFITPFSQVWGFILPQFVRFRVQDLVDNLGFPRRFLNTLLQGRPGRAGIELSRFVVNTSIGLVGLWDPATKLFKWPQYDEDFDQTLGVWGMGQGIFLTWPMIGPSSARATLALPLDIISPYFAPFGAGMLFTINDASLGEADDYRTLKKMSIDPYIAIRDIYVQSRHKKVHNRE